MCFTRKMKNGKAFYPDQSMTRKQALRSFTLDAAYAAFQEKRVGSISVGKLADFVVLSQNIITIAADKIPKTKVEMTIVGGEIVFEMR